MDLDTKPASDYPLPDLTQLLNQSFEKYLVPIAFNLNQFLTMIRRDSVDLAASRVLIYDDQLVGIALIARRGWTSRLAAMGIVQSMRGKRAGSWFMERLIEEARERGDHELLLEVIEQNEYAVRLYQSCGFQTVRRLIGFQCAQVDETSTLPLEEIDLLSAGHFISQYGLSDLPWQLAGETIAHLTPPACAYQSDGACVVISNPEVEHVVIWSVVVQPEARGKHLGGELIKAVMAKYPHKTWHVSAILPEELGYIYERLGFQKESLSQWQMKLPL
jgi:GNAT superfamily N-acetyltransferase